MSHSLIEDKQLARNKSYLPDLDELLSQCELNYGLLLRVFPALSRSVDKASGHTIGTKLTTESQSLLISVEVTDCAPYTTTIGLSLQNTSLSLTRKEAMIVRLYYDAQLVEVMQGSGPAALPAIYQSMPGKGIHADEKKQLNGYLGECLKACLLNVKIRAIGSQG